METFGQWLRRHRLAKGLTLEQLAERAGVSFSYISTLERGQKHTITDKDIQPQRNKVQALAKAVGGNLNEALEAAGWSAPAGSAGFIWRMANTSDEAAYAELWKSLSPEQQDAVRELVLSTIRSLAEVSREITRPSLTLSRIRDDDNSTIEARREPLKVSKQGGKAKTG